MSSDRTIFISNFFRWLRTIEYVWLKSVLNRPEDTPLESDIDLLVREKDLGQVLCFIAEQDDVKRCAMRHEHEATYLQLEFNDGSKLKIDLLTALVRKQYHYLTNDYLLQNRVWKNDIVTYNAKALLEHSLLFNCLNHAGLPEKYWRHFEATGEEEKSALLLLINGKYGTSFHHIREMATYSASARHTMVEHLNRQPENDKLTRLKRYTRFIYNILRSKATSQNSLKLPRTITFTGVDGAGKTTLLNDLKQVLAEKLQKPVVVLRHRPSLLPILSAYKHGKATAEANSAATLPRQGTNGNSVSSLLRFSYYFADYLLGQIWVWLRYTLPGTTVIFDRYYFDFIVDGKRSNISLGEALPKWLYRFIAKPDLNIFLYAAPEVIRERKQELPIADIQKMTSQYRALFIELADQYKGHYLAIENQDRAATLSTILTHYFNAQKSVNEQLGTSRPLVNRQSPTVNTPIPC